MSKQGKIVSAVGVSCLGRGEKSVEAHNAMVSAILAGHAAGHGDDEIKAALDKARSDMKTPAENA